MALTFLAALLIASSELEMRNYISAGIFLVGSAISFIIYVIAKKMEKEESLTNKDVKSDTVVEEEPETEDVSEGDDEDLVAFISDTTSQRDMLTQIGFTQLEAVRIMKDMTDQMGDYNEFEDFVADTKDVLDAFIAIGFSQWQVVILLIEMVQEIYDYDSIEDCATDMKKIYDGLIKEGFGPEEATELIPLYFS